MPCRAVSAPVPDHASTFARMWHTSSLPLPLGAGSGYSRIAMPQALAIRHATPADLESLVAMEQASFSGDRLSRRQLGYHLGNPKAAFLLGTLEGEIAGYGLLLFRSGSRLARLYSLAVAASARGRGLGYALLAEAEIAARRRGCKHLQLEVRVDNAAAIALYERTGYRRVASLDGYYEDGAGGWRYRKGLS